MTKYRLFQRQFTLQYAFTFKYGLYSSFAGSFIYILFGTTPEINIGPTALLSLLTFTYTNGTNADFAVMLCFLGGFIQLMVGFARLGLSEIY